MAINFLPNPVYRFKDTSDSPLVGGLVFTYDTGTTDKQTVWKDKAKVAAHVNPIVLDSRGEAEIWFDGTIDLVTAPVGDTDPPSSAIETITGVQSSITTSLNAQDGLIVNNSFESSSAELTNWTSTPASGATIAVDSSAPVHGSNSVKFTAGGSGGGKLESDFIAIPDGEVLDVVGWVKSDGVSLTNEFKISFYDKDKVSVSTVTAYTNSGTSTASWAKFYGVGIIPATAVWCKAELHGSSAGAGITWFDGIFLSEGSRNSVKRFCYLTGSVTSVGSVTVLVWPTETSDNYNTHAASATSIIIPAWCNYIRTSAHINFGAQSLGVYSVAIINNTVVEIAAGIIDSADGGSATNNHEIVSLSSDIYAVSSGDAITVSALQTSGGAKLVTSSSYFIVEFLIL